MKGTLAGPLSIEVLGGTLVVLLGKANVKSVPIGPEPCIVGRHERCALVLSDPKVSSTHVEFTATDRGARVRDLGSTNGTFLGDEPLAEVLEVRLTKPTRLSCGDTLLEYRPHPPRRIRLPRSEHFGPMVGATPVMRALFARLRVLAPTNLSVLIEGETGTGKELVAQALHRASDRANKPFVVLDCAAIPASLAEGMLFGHEKGAFTGAVAKQPSPFVEAHGGTVFLDELGELPLELQPKLLRVLAERRVKSVGSSAYRAVDVRIVAATRRDLLHEINRGTFRDDLYFRVAEERVRLPPLRERREDVAPLVRQIMSDLGKGGAFERVTARSIDQLMAQRWSGNVRELRSLVMRALSYDRGGRIDLGVLLEPSPGHNVAADRDEPSPKVPFDDVKRSYYRKLFEACDGNLTDMARVAEVSRVTVRANVRRYRLGAGSRGKP